MTSTRQPNSVVYLVLLLLLVTTSCSVILAAGEQIWERSKEKGRKNGKKEHCRWKSSPAMT